MSPIGHRRRSWPAGAGGASSVRDLRFGKLPPHHQLQGGNSSVTHLPLIRWPLIGWSPPRTRLAIFDNFRPELTSELLQSVSVWSFISNHLPSRLIGLWIVIESSLFALQLQVFTCALSSDSDLRLLCDPRYSVGDSDFTVSTVRISPHFVIITL